MSTKNTSPIAKGAWTLSDIPFDQIDRAQIRQNENLFFILAGAALIEGGSDIYAHLLINHFGELSEVSRWLATQWEQEELQHGEALKLYVNYVWPEFDWDGARKKFLAEYSNYCSPNQLEASQALELAGRCVVETGTAVYYRALHDYTDEPVLKQLAANIWSDEVRHYKHFYHYFTLYNQSERNGRWKISVTLAKRLFEIRNEDAKCALLHLFTARYPNEAQFSAHFRTVSAQARALIMHNMTPEMMIKMFLKPLDLPVRLRPYIQRPITKAMQRFLTA